MGAVRAGNFKTVGQSNAQRIDGGLRFDSAKSHYLSRTPGSAGNRTTWTWSGWIKRNKPGNIDHIFNGVGSGSPTYSMWYFYSGDQFNFDGGGVGSLSTAQVFRDFSTWYHIVLVFDTTQATSTNRIKLYVNGSQVTTFSSSSYPTQNADGGLNQAGLHKIGNWSTEYSNFYLSNVYFIDGQALDASYFGFTDPLTNTWRPKKLSSSVAFGTNGFYLPFDGSAPIGKDQSGKGNDWTPVNFGGSTALDKATGALPILNTDGGGKVARVGVRTDSNASSLVLALPLVGISSDFSNAINSGTSNKTITATNATATSSYSNFYGGSFDFSGTASAKSLSFSPGSDLTFGTGDFTIEAWVYMISRTTSYNQYVLDSNGRVAILTGISYGYEQITFYDTANAYTTTSAVVQYGKWQHWAVTRQSGTIRIFVDGVSQTLNATSSTTNIGAQTTGYIGNFNSPAGTYNANGYIQDFRIYKGLAKYTSNFIPASTDPDIVPDSPSGVSYSSNVALVPSTDGAVAFDGSGDYLSLASSADFAFGTGDYTVECFAYPNQVSSLAGAVSAGPAYANFAVVLNSGNWIYYSSSSNSSWDINGLTIGTAVANTWVHIAVTRQSGTVRTFLNGVLTNTSTGNTQNMSNSAAGYVGYYYNNYVFTGHISNAHVVKGTALYTANFTPPTAPISSVANTKLLCCKSNSSATTADVTPGTITANGDAKASNFNPFTTNIKTVRGLQSGYATWDPLSKQTNCTLSNGNLNWASTSTASVISIANIGMSSGKWYCEHTCTSGSNMFGLHRMAGTLPTSYVGGNADNWGYYADNGNKYNNSSSSSYGSTFTTGDVIGIAFDADTGSLTFYKNGVSQGVAYTGLTNGPYTFAIGNGGASSGTPNAASNFGQKPFKFPPPAGFQPLTLANLPRPTIVRPDQYVGIVTYTGNGTSQSLNVGFKPDFVWAKSRSTTYYHSIVDSVRGTGKVLYTNTTGADDNNSNIISSLNSNGFSVGSDASANQNGGNMVAWCWKAGGNSNTYNINDIGYSTASAAGLTAGSITPTGASVNTKSGFSIISFTAQTSGSATVSHGLGKAPAFWIYKPKDNTTNWYIYHQSLGSSAWLNFTTGAATTGNTAAWGGVDPTSSVFTHGSGLVNQGNCIIYCWTEIPGFSKFGSYTGNGPGSGGSYDGPYIQCGFRPRWILIRSTSAARDWLLYDAVRGVYNPQAEGPLQPNTTGTAYGTSYLNIDILSNGFKIRDGITNLNNSGETHIFAAFAEAPSINLYGAQANAR